MKQLYIVEPYRSVNNYLQCVHWESNRENEVIVVVLHLLNQGQDMVI